MRMKASCNWAAIFIYTWILVGSAIVPGATATTLSLERAFPRSERVGVSQLRERDRARHERLLQSETGVVDFPVAGTFNPYVVGLYYTTVKMGTPAQEFHVQIDTGSDVLWVSCTSCSGCPSSTNLPFNSLKLFDTEKSSSASTVSCTDQECSLGAQASDTLCDTQSNQCSYQFEYGDGSATSGYYVSDLLHFTTSGSASSNATTENSAKVVFGCSTAQSGTLSKSDRAVDGIFGFGQQSLSVISQLSSQGKAPQAFSHCLRGDSQGGGILVLGEIVEPGMVYTPLVPDMPHYNLYLQSIAVGNSTLSIDSSVFDTTTSNGTIIDSGTTLAYLAEAAYTPFAKAIDNAVSQTAQSVSSKQNGQCYVITSSVNDVFPKVSLNFKGGASMVLDPDEYLLLQNSLGSTEVWCIGIQNNPGQDMTILGDLVLQNKAVVYDLARQRMGWVDYDCSSTVNVTVNLTGSNTFINTGQVSDNSSSSITSAPLLGIFTLTFFLALFTSLL